MLKKYSQIRERNHSEGGEDMELWLRGKYLSSNGRRILHNFQPTRDC